MSQKWSYVGDSFGMNWDLICFFFYYCGVVIIKNEMEIFISFSEVKYQVQCLVQSWYSRVDSYYNDYNYDYCDY